MKEFNLMPHGFLSYNFPIWGMQEESMAGIRLGTEWLCDMLHTAHPDGQPVLTTDADQNFDEMMRSFRLQTQEEKNSAKKNGMNDFDSSQDEQRT